MTPEGIRWFNALRAHSAAARKRDPLPKAAKFTEIEFACYRLQGGTLLAWLEHFAPKLLQEREMFSHLDGTEREPYIVVLSDTTGLAAATEIVGKAKQIVFLKSAEFDAFTDNEPDEKHKWHIQFVNEIALASKEDAARAKKKYRLKRGEEFWIHHEESVMGALFIRGAKHLLKWDGSNLSVVEEGFGVWIS